MDAGLFIIGAPDIVGEEEYGGQLAQVFSIGRDGMISKLEDLLPQDAPLHNFFGHAVDISGSSIIVGAYKDSVTGVGGGAVYLYGVEENGSISGKRKFHATHTKNGDDFGSSVTIDGLYIAAGAPRASTDAAADSGAVHVFGFDKQGAVVELAELYDDNATEYEEFGHAIDLHNGLLAIGVPYANYKSKEGCGKVQLYRLSPEGKAVYLDTLYNPNPVAWDEFGSAVSVSGAHVCVSAGSGVFIYTLNAAGKADLIAKIPTPQEAGYFGFGAAVINGDRIVVYARERKGQHTASYRYIYQLFPLSSGIEVGEIGKLEAAGSWQNSAVDGDRVLIGAPELKASGASSPSGGFYLLDIEADTKIYVYSETHQQTDINRSYTGPIYAIDAASPAGELSYVIDAFADGGFFTLDGRDILLPNALDYLPPIDSDADGVYQLSVTMEDPAGNSADVYVDVNVSR